MATGPYDGLDASLQGFEHPASPKSLRYSSLPPSEPATEDNFEEDARPLDSDAASAAGGYSPPAWRRLGNGGRSSGFWRGPHSDILAAMPPRMLTRESSLCSSDSEDEAVLEKAIHTRLPQGSMSPEKGRSPSPSAGEDTTLRLEQVRMSRFSERKTPSDNYIRFGVRAEVQQRTAPIESAVSLIRKNYNSLTSSWASTICTILIAVFSISLFKGLLEPATPRPAGDLVKVAGIARSFEPLIYYSEHAVTQVHDLQATSVAIWDLGESVRSSDIREATSIVSDLDTLSETMRTLSLEMTKFFARVDGDIDGILNVMDWAKMHLNRLRRTLPPSTLSAAYDNIHNILSHAGILETSSGAPTTLGTLTTYIFGLSNPQREQRVVQRLFVEFLAVLEDSIQAELQHSVTLFALFEAVDRHLLNLGRTVIRETYAQEELHADLLASLWVRILGARAQELRKFEQNRVLLQNVREKTVRNKGILQDHHSKLLTLKASLETLRGKLVSPLVRGANSSTLSLEDQTQGISSVSNFLANVRHEQRGKVMHNLFASVPSKKYMIEEGNGVMGERD